MAIDDARSRNVPKSILNSTTTSVGRFYEKRHQFYGALDQYSKALSSNPDDTAIYIDRSRIFLKMGSIDKAQEDTGDGNVCSSIEWAISSDLDSALNLIAHAQQQPTLLSYYVCLQKAEVLYAGGEFELGENASISIVSTRKTSSLAHSSDVFSSRQQSETRSTNLPRRNS